MAPYVRSTVDRLDRPSAYFQSRVSTHPWRISTSWPASANTHEKETNLKLTLLHAPLQNKRRRDHRERDRDGDENMKLEPEQPPEDPLKDAATLYVGNL